MAVLKNQFGQFIPTTEILDTAQVDALNVNSREFKELFIRLMQSHNRVATALNSKTSGIYSQDESVDGNLWFPKPGLSSATNQVPNQRQEYVVVVNFGPMRPNAGPRSVNHGIGFGAGGGLPGSMIGTNSRYTFTQIYGCASDTTNLMYVPIPYASATGDNIELKVNQTQVTIMVNSSSWATYDTTYVILKYLKN